MGGTLIILHDIVAPGESAQSRRFGLSWSFAGPNRKASIAGRPETATVGSQSPPLGPACAASQSRFSHLCFLP